MVRLFPLRVTEESGGKGAQSGRENKGVCVWGGGYLSLPKISLLCVQALEKLTIGMQSRRLFSNVL
jgi:hypothetical protein